MLLSIFTPTNNISAIFTPFKSIYNQIRDDCNLQVEWVVVPNCNIDIPKEITQEPWVKIVRCPDNIKAIGGLKKFACDNCTGDVYIELDHDDELMPGSLKEIRDALSGKLNAFLFSDAMYIKSDKTSPLFGKSFGWQFYEYEGHPINKTFTATARSLCEIFFTPDHVRVWTKEAYKLSGGHDPNMVIGDDHDLVIKTYLAKSEFVQIEKPLYKYYLHGNNTWTQDPDKVRIQQEKNKKKYLHNLVKEWCRRENYPVMSFDNNFSVDTLSNFYNTPSNSIGCIFVNDALTSIPANKECINFMNNIYRMLVPGGWLLTHVPSTDGRGAFCDPTHVSFWNELSFRYYTEKDYAKLIPAINCKFQQVVLETYFPNKWHEKNNISYVRADMCAVKGQILPGGSSFNS